MWGLWAAWAALGWAACATPPDAPPPPLRAEAPCEARDAPEVCFGVAAALAGEWNAINLAPDARAEALEPIARATGEALARACARGHRCACLALEGGDCAREEICAEPGWSEADGERCPVGCAEEAACARGVFWFLAPVPR